MPWFLATTEIGIGSHRILAIAEVLRIQLSIFRVPDPGSDPDPTHITVFKLH